MSIYLKHTDFHCNNPIMICEFGDTDIIYTFV